MSDKGNIFQEDFDRIARVTTEGWNNNSYYHNFLLRHVAMGCREALDVGCGTGEFARLLASRASRVTALDLSPVMIDVARERSRPFSNIDFHVGDAVEMDLPAGHFDCVASIATLHHLPFTLMLSKWKRALKRGGVLLILDLYEAEGWTDAFVFAAAMPVNVTLRLIKRHRLRAPREVREAWAEHERHDSHMTLSEIRRACAAALPGASLRRHLLWRYSIVWKKPMI